MALRLQPSRAVATPDARFAPAAFRPSLPHRPAWRKQAVSLLVVLAFLYASATVVRIVVRKYYVFLPSYLSWSLTPAPTVTGPTHLVVLFTDHFEPNRQPALVSQWTDRYASMAARHHDADGRLPLVPVHA